MIRRLDLFYYTNDNVVRDSLVLNAIVCASYNEKLRPQSLGGIDDSAVFLTHKKLNKDQQYYGLEENGFETPVVLRLSFLEHNMSAIKCRLIGKRDDHYECEDGILSEYDENKHIGVFIASYIPFSYLTGVLFQNEDEMKDFSRPSPDLWEPELLYEIMEQADFMDEVDLEELKKISIDNYDKSLSIKSASVYCRQRALLYFSIAATNHWKVENYVFNFDTYVASLLNIGADKISSVLEPLELSPDKIMNGTTVDYLINSDSIEYAIYEAILAEISQDNPQTVYDESRFNNIANVIISKLCENKDTEEVIDRYQQSLILLMNSLYKSTGLLYEDLLEELKDSQVLKALSVYLKNPHDVVLFAESIHAYGVTQEDARIAWTFYGYVNGMLDLMGEEKTRILVNRRIDEKATNFMSEELYKTSVCLEEDLFVLFGDRARQVLLDFEPKAKRTLSVEEIYQFFASDAGRNYLSYEKIKQSCPKVKGFDWKKYTYYEIPEDLTLGRVNKKELDDIIKRIKTEHIDQNQFYKDLLSSKEMFEKFYCVAEDMWKQFYLDCIKKVRTNAND